MSGLGGGFDQVSLDIWIIDHLVLHLESSKGSLQLVFSGTPCFFLMNSAKASMPVFVLKRVASWWSGAPSSIILLYSLCDQHSNTMCLQVCSPALHGQLVGSCMLWVW